MCAYIWSIRSKENHQHAWVYTFLWIYFWKHFGQCLLLLCISEFLSSVLPFQPKGLFLVLLCQGRFLYFVNLTCLHSSQPWKENFVGYKAADWQCFAFRNLNMSFHWYLPVVSMVSQQGLCAGLLENPVSGFSLCTLFVIISLWCMLVCTHALILIGVHWNSWMCNLMFFNTS